MSEITFTVILITTEIIFSIVLLKLFSRAGMKKSTLFTTGLTLTAWLFGIYYLLDNKFFSNSEIPQVAFTLGVVIPIIIGYFASVFWQPLKQTICKLSIEDFLFLQIWRAAFGILFFFTTTLPVWFQYVGGLGDIAAGTGAFFALLAFKKKQFDERKAIINGNLLGIIDFIIVLNLGVMVVLKDQSPDIMFNLIPLYVVPIFILLHVFSLQRLAKTNDKANRQVRLSR